MGVLTMEKWLARRRRNITRNQLNCGAGRNGDKRARKEAIATLKGVPGGWKKAVRFIDAEERKAQKQRESRP